MAKRRNNKYRTLRVRAGWSQADLAEKLQVSQVTISNWETGKTKPRPAQREDLDAVLGTKESVESSAASSPMATWVNQGRVKLGYSVPELATRAKLTPPAIYRIEAGLTANVRVKTREKLEKVLGPVPAEISIEGTLQA